MCGHLGSPFGFQRGVLFSAMNVTIAVASCVETDGQGQSCEALQLAFSAITPMMQGYSDKPGKPCADAPTSILTASEGSPQAPTTSVPFWMLSKHGLLAAALPTAVLVSMVATAVARKWRSTVPLGPATDDQEMLCPVVSAAPGVSGHFGAWDEATTNEGSVPFC